MVFLFNYFSLVVEAKMFQAKWWIKYNSFINILHRINKKITSKPQFVIPWLDRGIQKKQAFVIPWLDHGIQKIQSQKAMN